MRRFLTIFSLAVLLCTFSCQKESPNEPEARVAELIAQAGSDVDGQRFDEAMEKALEALDLAGQAGSDLLKVKALSCITGIDIMASRDADAWEKAVEAEAIARASDFTEELTGILISKGKLCSYAEISPDTGRNDEGLEYVREALELAERSGNFEQQSEACYIIASLYINKNRWSDPIDREIYRTAGEYLDRGQAIAEEHDIPRLRRNGLLFRSRWFQQGDENEEAIKYFTQVLDGLGDTDHVTAASLYDRLVRLYTRTGDYQKALDSHDGYVYENQRYMAQRADETLQEMETRFEVLEKERQIERRGYHISLLILLILLAAAAVIIIFDRLRKARRRNAELQKINDTKEQLISFLSKDLGNPANNCTAAIEALSDQAATLTGEQIKEKCQEIARSAQSLNDEVANYVGDMLIERSRRISDIGLTRRELEIIRLSARGLSAADIAKELYLSTYTVNNHRQRIYSKLEVHSVSEMVSKATELGIL